MTWLEEEHSIKNNFEKKLDDVLKHKVKHHLKNELVLEMKRQTIEVNRIQLARLLDLRVLKNLSQTLRDHRASPQMTLLDTIMSSLLHKKSSTVELFYCRQVDLESLFDKQKNELKQIYKQSEHICQFFENFEKNMEQDTAKMEKNYEQLIVEMNGKINRTRGDNPNLDRLTDFLEECSRELRSNDTDLTNYERLLRALER